VSGRTLDEALAHARSLGVDRLDAQLLVGHVLGRARSWVIAHGDALLDDDPHRAFTGLAARRARGEPLAQLVGGKDFHGLWLAVTRDVLVPRPETELLVACILEAIAERSAPRVLDLGTGSGAIAIAVAHARPDVQVFASDASAEALEVARANAARLRLSIRFELGDWWHPWRDELPFDVVAANPPYVADGDPHLDRLLHEPRLALVGGVDGLEAIRAIVDGAAPRLASGGRLWIEHGHDQARAARDLLAAAGFGSIETRPDLAGVERVTGGRRM
jgi:release factor glutamine methyltransferase